MFGNVRWFGCLVGLLVFFCCCSSLYQFIWHAAVYNLHCMYINTFFTFFVNKKKVLHITLPNDARTCHHNINWFVGCSVFITLCIIITTSLFVVIGFQQKFNAIHLMNSAVLLSFFCFDLQQTKMNTRRMRERERGRGEGKKGRKWNWTELNWKLSSALSRLLKNHYAMQTHTHTPANTFVGQRRFRSFTSYINCSGQCMAIKTYAMSPWELME